MADMCEKIGIVFAAAAFLQSDHGGEGLLYFAMAVIALYASIRLSGDPDGPR